MYVTQVAIQYGHGDITSRELPIPPAVIGKTHMTTTSSVVMTINMTGHSRVNEQRRHLVNTIPLTIWSKASLTTSKDAMFRVE
jgi:hypothetical protein